LDAKIVHILHDEIIVEAKAEIAGEVAEIMKDSMESAFESMFGNVPFKAKPVVVDSWGE